jgi:hypothetical protein
MSSAPTDARVTARRVRRRHVFYLGGFDPQGPAHYHRLYAEQAARQAAVSGYAIDVGPRERAGPHASRWAADATWPDATRVQSTIEFLRWDDIVREHWPRSRWAVMLSALGTTARQLANGVLWKILKTSWPAFLVLFLPPLLVVALLAMLAAIAALAASLVLHGPVLTALVLTAALAWLLSLFARWAEAKVQMAWLMRSTRFILRQARGETPDLEARLDEFAARVLAVRAAGEVDEILVVGHSSGAMLAVSVVARAVADAAPESGPALSLLTLGECIPMLSYQPEAGAFRAELARIARSGAWSWVDFTAPPDGCCFALVDPTAVCEERAAASDWHAPKRLSPRFAQLFDPPAYRSLRRDKYRCHFQYLMASQLPGAYDYFAITAGPQSLVGRYAGTPGVEDFIDFQTFGGPTR